MSQGTLNFSLVDVDHICAHVADIKNQANKLYKCNEKVARARKDLANLTAGHCIVITHLVDHAATTSKFFEYFLTRYKNIEESEPPGPTDALAKLSFLQREGVRMLEGLKTLRENYVTEVEEERKHIEEELKGAGLSLERRTQLASDTEVKAICTRLKI